MASPAPQHTRLVLLGASLAPLLLWLFYAATEHDPIFGTPSVRLVVEGAAVGATALLFVTVGGWLILGLAAARDGAAPVTGLQRVLVYALLGFAAAFAALRHFDFD